MLMCWWASGLCPAARGIMLQAQKAWLLQVLRAMQANRHCMQAPLTRPQAVTATCSNSSITSQTCSLMTGQQAASHLTLAHAAAAAVGTVPAGLVLLLTCRGLHQRSRSTRQQQRRRQQRSGATEQQWQQQEYTPMLAAPGRQQLCLTHSNNSKRSSQSNSRHAR